MTDAAKQQPMLTTVSNTSSFPKREFSDVETIARIERYIAEKPENSRIFTITPKIAQKLLEDYNIGNRPAKPTKITEFANDMMDGEWKLTGDTLKFSDKNKLRDGQNRLEACIKANKAFRTHVVFGIDDGVFPWMDRGKPRQGSDSLAILGVENSSTIAGAVRWIELLKTKTVKNRTVFTPAQIIELHEKCDDVKLKAALALARKVYHADRTPITLATALAYVFEEKGGALAARFFESWATGNYAAPFRSLRLCSTEIRKIHEYSQGRVNDVVRAALWVIAWNNVVQRRSGQKSQFKWQQKETFPTIRGA